MTPLAAYLVLFVAVGAAFILVHLLLGKLIRPAQPDPEKGTGSVVAKLQHEYGVFDADRNRKYDELVVVDSWERFVGVFLETESLKKAGEEHEQFLRR